MPDTTSRVILLDHCRLATKMLAAIKLAASTDAYTHDTLRGALTKFCARTDLRQRIIDTNDKQLVETFLPYLLPYAINTRYTIADVNASVIYAFTRYNPLLLGTAEMSELGIHDIASNRNAKLRGTYIRDDNGKLIPKPARTGASVLHPMDLNSHRFYYQLSNCPEWQRNSPMYLFHAQAWARRGYASILASEELAECPISGTPLVRFTEYNQPLPAIKPDRMPIDAAHYLIAAWRWLTKSNSAYHRTIGRIGPNTCGKQISIQLPFYTSATTDRRNVTGYDHPMEFFCQITHRDHPTYLACDTYGMPLKQQLMRVGTFLHIMWDEVRNNFGLSLGSFRSQTPTAELVPIDVSYEECTRRRNRGRPAGSGGLYV